MQKFLMILALIVPTIAKGNAPKTCYGFRGNGSSVFSTIGGISRLLDQYPAPDALFGTSSGSVAAFLTESVLIPSNEVYSIGSDGTPLAKEAINERRSFMLKSFPLLVDGLFSPRTQLGKEITISSEIYSLLSKLQGFLPHREKSEDGILSHAYVKTTLGGVALLGLRNNTKELHKLISPEFYRVLGLDEEPANPELIDKIIENLLAFQGLAENPEFRRQNLMYPGIINFDYIFYLMGHIADWYAGYGNSYPTERMRSLLDRCADGSRGLWWNEIEDRSSCSQEYFNLFLAYVNPRLAAGVQPKRLHQAIGSHIPAYVSTSAIGGQDRNGHDIADLMNRYTDSGQFDRIDTDILASREHFHVLYFSPENKRQALLANPMGFDDILTEKTVAMGSLSWLMAMKASDGQTNMFVGVSIPLWQEPTQARFSPKPNQFLLLFC